MQHLPILRNQKIFPEVLFQPQTAPTTPQLIEKTRRAVHLDLSAAAPARLVPKILDIVFMRISVTVEVENLKDDFRKNH